MMRDIPLQERGEKAAAVAASAPRRGRGGAVSIVLSGVTKRFDDIVALEPVDLTIKSGSFLAIVGPSGCGKSTLLRIIAGLIAPSSGALTLPGHAVGAFVFQEAALLPWRNVQANAELVMELENIPKAERVKRARHALAQVGLEGFERRYPHQLSGGMKMRLSLARAMALRPDFLLLDEPLAAVDELTRDQLQDELLALCRNSGVTAVLVTHNVYEAVYLADQVVVMSARPGRVIDRFDVPFGDDRAPELRSSPEFVSLATAVSASLRKGRVDD